MAVDQKRNEIPPEEENIREILSKRFNLKAYWTFREGINFFLTEEYRNSFPLQVIINDSLFDTIKRDVETQRLETANSVEEIEQILNYDPVVDFEKLNSQRSELRKAEIKWRNLKRYGSIDIERKLSYSEKKEEKLRYFCSNIKIKPGVLILYIIKHIDKFSSEIQIPLALENLLSTFKKTSPLKNDKNIEQTKTEIELKKEIEQLLKDVVPELENLFETTKNSFHKIKEATAQQICDDPPQGLYT